MAISQNPTLEIFKLIDSNGSFDYKRRDEILFDEEADQVIKLSEEPEHILRAHEKLEMLKRQISVAQGYASNALRFGENEQEIRVTLHYMLEEVITKQFDNIKTALYDDIFIQDIIDGN